MSTITVDDNTRILMKETASYEIIGNDAEIACFKIYHEHYPSAVAEAAKERVIKANLRFVLKFAIDYHKISGMPIADFFSEGKLGLMDAFYKFDYTTGVKYGSYAVWYVRTRMSRIVNEEKDLIRVPVKLRKRVLKMLRKGVDPASIKYGKLAESAITSVVSLDRPCDDGSEDGDSLSNFITYDGQDSQDEEYSASLVRDRLDKALTEDITEEEREVIKSSFGIGREESSLNTVATEIGTSKEWARRIKARALSKLRDSRGLARLKGMV